MLEKLEYLPKHLKNANKKLNIKKIQTKAINFSHTLNKLDPFPIDKCFRKEKIKFCQL